MTRLLLGLAVLVLAYAVGRVRAWRRGPPTDQTDIRYHWRSWLGRVAAATRRSEGNWCVTLGRQTYVRRDAIEAQSAAHEFSHSLDAHAWGAPLYVLRCLAEYAIHGYARAPVEVRAHQYAVDHALHFRRVAEGEPWPPPSNTGV